MVIEKNERPEDWDVPKLKNMYEKGTDISTKNKNGKLLGRRHSEEAADQQIDSIWKSIRQVIT